MAATSDGLLAEDEVFSLHEFVEVFDLPKWVSVVGGKEAGIGGNGPTDINKGDILMLRTLAVESVTLSFNDTDTGNKRLVHVTPDSQVKFNVLLPFPDFKNTGKRTVYQTVADLLKVCPTYFKANVCYDDPYLPAIVKAGEVFRFIRQIRKIVDRRVYLQCEDAEGNIIELPDECRGDFTAVEDDRAYTMKEILDLGAVTRKLKLTTDNRKLSLATAAGAKEDEEYYKNINFSEGNGNALHRIMGLPLSYTGLITFHKPNMFLAVSPSSNMTSVWKVPLDLDIRVKRYIPEEYEKPGSGSPVQRMYKLNELLNTFIEEMPVLATLVHYKDMPTEFRDIIKPGDEIIIHTIEREDKILAKADNMHYCISKKLKGKFRHTLKKANSFEELKELKGDNKEILFKIMQDVASDFPVPYSLQAGECLRIKSFDVKQHKLKAKSKTFGPFSVIQCERMTEKGRYEKILLPVDLDVCMHEIPSKEKRDGSSSAELFIMKPPLPISVDYLADYTNVWSCLPICSELSLTNFVTEPHAVVSVLPKYDEEEAVKAVSPNVRYCLVLPARHHVMFTVKACLGFPPGYFKYPDRSEYVSVPVEKLSKACFDELVRHNDSAYEDYEPESPVSAPGAGAETLLPVRATKQSESNDDGVNRRLSRSLTNLFRAKGKSARAFWKRKKDKKRDDDADSGSTSDVQNFVANLTYGDPGATEHYDDDNIYETYDFPGPLKKPPE